MEEPSQFAFFYSDNEMEEACSRNKEARDKIHAQNIGQETWKEQRGY